MDVIKRKTIKSVDKNVEKLEPSYVAGRNINGAVTLEKRLAVSQKVKIELPKEAFYSHVYTTGELPGQGSLVGYSPYRQKESDIPEALEHAHMRELKMYVHVKTCM